ncbi:hypothetical protein Y032_0237g3258 [Ancylostoma ceylanicum]|uniref:Uncharacterized protein n=1 Tax=Ancylostoma ceylanicum TaxID=53326 RepID=A0A016SES5_9BILA|nr:hypothetical protein Y032_0237g3258 [Ancylostoma ceylanicum]
MWFVLAGEAQLYTRALSAKCATESTPLDWHFNLDEDENFELEYWQERLNGESSKRFDERTPNPTFLLLTDASSLGLGGVLYGRDEKETIFTNIARTPACINSRRSAYAENNEREGYPRHALLAFAQILFGTKALRRGMDRSG